LPTEPTPLHVLHFFKLICPVPYTLDDLRLYASECRNGKRIRRLHDARRTASI
jgi:hypothetical protein